MKKYRQILAVAGIAALLAMYIITFISSFGHSEISQILFRASLACTFIVPVFLYAVIMVARVLQSKRPKKIDTIVFDVGDVLVAFPWQAYGISLGISPKDMAFIEKNVFSTDIWDEFDRGLKPYEAVVDNFCAAFPGHEKEIHLILDDLYKALQPMPYAEEWVKSLKEKGYRIYILSNWSRRNYELLLENDCFSFLKWTDGATWSFQVHHIKPERAIFQDLCGTWQINPQQAVFIDDNPRNIEAAKAFGLGTIHFTGYEDAKKQLSELGIG